MQKENINVVHCPPCGENVALATKRGAYKAISLMSPSIGPADHFLRKGGRMGFTLIELLVVVLIIGILAAVAVPQYHKAVYKSYYAKLKAIAASIAEAQEVYYLANGHYSTNFEKLAISMPPGKLDTSENNIYYYDWGSCSISDGDYAQVGCKNNKIKMGYQQRFAHAFVWPKRRICVANETTDTTHIRSQICKAETGATTGDPRDEYNAVFWYYK